MYTHSRTLICIFLCKYVTSMQLFVALHVRHTVSIRNLKKWLYYAHCLP